LAGFFDRDQVSLGWKAYLIAVKETGQ